VLFYVIGYKPWGVVFTHVAQMWVIFDPILKWSKSYRFKIFSGSSKSSHFGVLCATMHFDTIFAKLFPKDVSDVVQNWVSKMCMQNWEVTHVKLQVLCRRKFLMM
jgi:hypothetical protein